MRISGTHFNYYHICHRKLWLFANEIQMEQTSLLVAEGKLIHDTSYPFRSGKYTEIQVDGVKIDYYDASRKIVHEIKKSDSHEEAHEWQAKFYLYVLKRNGIDKAKAILEYPKFRKTVPIQLTAEDEIVIADTMKAIVRITTQKECPPLIHNKKCRNCSYFDFCYSGEYDEK